MNCNLEQLCTSIDYVRETHRTSTGTGLIPLLNGQMQIHTYQPSSPKSEMMKECQKLRSRCPRPSARPQTSGSKRTQRRCRTDPRGSCTCRHRPLTASPRRSFQLKTKFVISGKGKKIVKHKAINTPRQKSVQHSKIEIFILFWVSCKSNQTRSYSFV